MRHALRVQLAAAGVLAATIPAFAAETLAPAEARAELARAAHAHSRDSRAVVVGLPAGYKSTTIAAPAGAAAGAVCEDPTNPNAFYVSVTSGFNFFRDIEVWRMELALGGGNETTATFSLVARGTTNVGGDLSDGDNRLDNFFGAVSPAVRGDGAVFLVESDTGTNAGFPNALGDRVLRLADANADNDARDIVAGSGEATTYVLPIATNAGDFAGAQAEFDAAGNAYVVTADGGGTGELLRIANGTLAQTVYASGVDYGAGVAIDSGSGAVFFGQTNASLTGGSVHRALDGNADDDAEDPGETVLLTSAIDGANDVAYDGAGTLYVSTNGTTHQVVTVDATTGAVAAFAAFPELFFQYVQSLAFDSGAQSFAPFTANVGSPGRRLVVIDAENGINVIEPELASAGVGDWMAFGY